MCFMCFKCVSCVSNVFHVFQMCFMCFKCVSCVSNVFQVTNVDRYDDLICDLKCFNANILIAINNSILHGNKIRPQSEILEVI